MSAIRAIISRTNPLGTTLLLYGDDLIDDNNELVSAVELPADVFEHLLAFSRGNQEIRAVINYSDDSSIKIYDYADTIVTDEDGVQGIILEDTGIILYSGTQPTIGEDILPFIVTGGGGGGSDLPEVDSDDNGDVLTVVDGEWDKATPPSPLPSVSGTDNGKVLTVVSGQWDKATPASLPAVSGSDNGKVLTVYNGQWTKANPTIGMNVERIEVQDWGNEYVLCKAWPDSGTYTNSNFDNVDAIYIYNGDDSISILGTFGYRYYYHSGQENRNSPVTKFFNPNSTYGIVLDADTAVMNITIENVAFTWSDDGYFSCSHN